MRNIKSVLGILTVGLGLGVQGQAQSFLTDGLAAYFPFHGNADDASGNGNDGTAIGVDLTADRIGAQTDAYSFNGTATSYIQVGDRSSLRMTSALTISAWVFQTATTDAQMVVSKEGEYWLGTWRSDPADPGTHKLYLALASSDSSTFNVIRLGNPPPLAKWTQIAVTFQNGSITGYMNGKVITNLTTSPSIGDTDRSMNDFRIGNRQLMQLGWNVEPFVGGIDDVRVYNRALSSSEVQQLYAYEAGPQVNLIKSVKPALSNLLISTNYQLQVSADLSAWTNTGSSFTATNTSMVYPQYFDVDNWNRLFFRVQVAP